VVLLVLKEIAMTDQELQRQIDSYNKRIEYLKQENAKRVRNQQAIAQAMRRTIRELLVFVDQLEN
jgi:septal ring factor EnvC (AmiA/AmiB activator)